MFGLAMEGGKQVLSPESAAASEIYDQFVTAQTFKSILGTFRMLCDTLRIKPTNFPNFYPKLKTKLRSWKVQALWAKFEKRASHKCYNRGKACANTKVLIIGCGPCGLRAAIEAQLLGAKVVVIEKRDRFSRNNVLHLWPFVIHDLRNLGAKKFYGKFCAGSIDHISIRQLQCILLKVALLLGVEVHEGVTFDDLVAPPVDQSQEKIGWRSLLVPRDHPVSQYEFDVIIGADGKRNTLKSFKRKEFRGKLAIAITANFINRHTEAEARVQEISGVAFIFNQKFFQDLRDYTGIDLENIVYYKDETHYFVMTAKKSSLIEKGVILNDYPETERLLSADNVNREALLDYAREAADFSTNFQMPNLDFAVNHYGQADVAMFDFTSMFAAESACRIVETRGHKLLQCLVGDSLLEPFWPTGSGCARGFLSSMDACWMIRSWALGTMTPVQVLAERESAYRLLAQTTHENLSKDFDEYSLNPPSRYPNINLNAVRPAQIKHLYETDRELKDEPLENYELPKKRKKKDSFISSDTLLNWCQRQVILYKHVRVENMTTSWKNGLVLCSIIHRYRPDLIDFNSLDEANCESNIQLAFDVCEREFGVAPVMTAKEMTESSVPDSLSVVAYVSQIYDVFRGQIPHIARAPLTDISPEERPTSPVRKVSSGRLAILSRIGQRLTQRKKYPVEKVEQDKGLNLDVDIERELAELRRAKKRRSLERERALFILNKDKKQPQIAGMKKLESSWEDREQFSSRVRDLEEKLYGNTVYKAPQQPVPPSQKKVGKISHSDWNVKMLEEKLKGAKPETKKEKEEVPKWSKDIFEEKLRTMDSKAKCETENEPVKYTDFDVNLKMLDKKLKEGNNLETGQRGMNKVSAMAEQILGGKGLNRPDSLPLQKTNSKSSIPSVINFQQGSENCYFCEKRVYLMERQSAQGKFFHRGCFKCECCHVALRLGNYGVGTEEPYVGKFLCLHHSSMRAPPKKRPSPSAELESKRMARIAPIKVHEATAAPKGITLEVPDKIDFRDRGMTPERVEFENTLDLTSEEELLSEIDEDEWTDRNFGMSANEYESTDSESDLSSDEMADEEREELQKVINKSFVSGGRPGLRESFKWFAKNKKVEDDDEVEDTDEEYDESDEEYSYEEYENEDGESTPTEGEPRVGAGEGPSEPDKSKSAEKNGEIHSSASKSVTHWKKDDYQTLKSNDETGSEDLESGSSSDGDYSDESETETEDGELDSNDMESSRKHEIPSIVIDVTTINAPNEEDDAYFETLQKQSINAEKTLEDLIRRNSVEESESAAQTPVVTPASPFEPIFEEIRPLVDDNYTKTLPKDSSKSRRPFSLIETADNLEKSCDKQFGSVDKMDNFSQKRKSSLESASSLPDLDKTKMSDRESSPSSAGSGNKLTESPTAKMMLKLKEKYLLGSTNEPESTASTSETTATKIEPVVKSLLDLISEKQKMLSPATSPSPTSAQSTPSSSEPSSRLAFSGFSLWSNKHFPTPPANPKPLTDSYDRPVATTAEEKQTADDNKSTSCDIKEQESRLKLETEKPVESDSTSDSFEAISKTDVPHMKIELTSVGTGLLSSNVEEPLNKIASLSSNSGPSSDIGDSSTSASSASDAIGSLSVISGCVLDKTSAAATNDDGALKSVSNLAENDGGSSKDATNSLAGASGLKLAFPCVIRGEDDLELDEFNHLNDSNITIRRRHTDVSEDLDTLSSSPEKIEESASTLKTETQNIVEKVKESEVVKEKVDSSSHEEDDTMGMISNSGSSSSDSTPSLDESIYHSHDVAPKSSQQFAAYVGSLTSRGITFGGVRDSIDIRKSAMKRHPIKMGVGLSYLRSTSMIEGSRIEEPTTPEKPKPNLISADEIPFADDESSNSSQDSKEKSVKKKKPLRHTPSTPVKRPSFEKPFNIVEMRSSSFPSLNSKSGQSVSSPNSPVTEGATPRRNMEELMADLRQLRTVEREKARQLARERARLKSDEELGIKGLDYAKLRRKYHKSESNNNIREEGSYDDGNDSLEIASPKLEEEDELDKVENFKKDSEVADIPDSSSPDSDVFDRVSPDSEDKRLVDCEAVAAAIENIKRLEMSSENFALSNEGDAVVISDEPEILPGQVADNVASDDVVETVEETEPTESLDCSKSDNANNIDSRGGVFIDLTASSSSTTTEEPQVSSESATTTSKTDGASCLESDISVQVSPEIGVDDPKKQIELSKAIIDNGVKSKSNSLLTKKDKSKKKQSVAPVVDKHKSKEKKGLLSILTSLAKSDSSKSKSKETEAKNKEKLPSPAASDVPLESSGIKVDGTPKESRFHKLRLSRSKEKSKAKRKSQTPELLPNTENSEVPTSMPSVDLGAPPISPSILAAAGGAGWTISPGESKSRKYVLGGGDKTAEITLDKHSLMAAMAVISKSASTAKVTNGTGAAPQAAEDNFSDVEDDLSQSSPGTNVEISDERRKKYEKMIQREQRLQEQKRLRAAQEIQRQLEELEVKQRSLECRGVEIEKALRGERTGSDENRKEQELLQEWLYLMQTKNSLMRQEQELMVKAKELELEDRHARLKARLYKLMQIEDSKKTDEQLEEEGRLLSEAYEIVNQRDNLITLLEETRFLEDDSNV